MNLSDLKPAPYNPRSIKPENAKALEFSLAEFGDISGITWNRRTGHLVSGHQRLDQLKKRYGGALELIEVDESHSVLSTPSGDVFNVRIVDWDVAKEKAANIAANSPHLMGEFTDKLGSVLNEVMAAVPDVGKSLKLDELTAAAKEVDAQSQPELRELTPAPLPVMTWVLIGVPTTRFIEISEEVEKISSTPDIFCEVTANSAES